MADSDDSEIDYDDEVLENIEEINSDNIENISSQIEILETEKNQLYENLLEEDIVKFNNKIVSLEKRIGLLKAKMVEEYYTNQEILDIYAKIKEINKTLPKSYKLASLQQKNMAVKENEIEIKNKIQEIIDKYNIESVVTVGIIIVTPSEIEWFDDPDKQYTDKQKKIIYNFFKQIHLLSKKEKSTVLGNKSFQYYTQILQDRDIEKLYEFKINLASVLGNLDLNMKLMFYNSTMEELDFLKKKAFKSKLFGKTEIVRDFGILESEQLTDEQIEEYTQMYPEIIDSDDIIENILSKIRMKYSFLFDKYKFYGGFVHYNKKTEIDPSLPLKNSSRIEEYPKFDTTKFKNKIKNIPKKNLLNCVGILTNNGYINELYNRNIKVIKFRSQPDQVRKLAKELDKHIDQIGFTKSYIKNHLNTNLPPSVTMFDEETKEYVIPVKNKLYSQIKLDSFNSLDTAMENTELGGYFMLNKYDQVPVSDTKKADWDFKTNILKYGGVIFKKVKKGTPNSIPIDKHSILFKKPPTLAMYGWIVYTSENVPIIIPNFREYLKKLMNVLKSRDSNDINKRKINYISTYLYGKPIYTLPKTQPNTQSDNIYRGLKINQIVEEIKYFTNVGPLELRNHISELEKCVFAYIGDLSTQKNLYLKKIEYLKTIIKSNPNIFKYLTDGQLLYSEVLTLKGGIFTQNETLGSLLEWNPNTDLLTQDIWDIVDAEIQKPNPTPELVNKYILDSHYNILTKRALIQQSNEYIKWKSTVSNPKNHKIHILFKVKYNLSSIKNPLLAPLKDRIRFSNFFKEGTTIENIIYDLSKDLKQYQQVIFNVAKDRKINDLGGKELIAYIMRVHFNFNEKKLVNFPIKYVYAYKNFYNNTQERNFKNLKYIGNLFKFKLITKQKQIYAIINGKLQIENVEQLNTRINQTYSNDIKILKFWRKSIYSPPSHFRIIPLLYKHLPFYPIPNNGFLVGGNFPSNIRMYRYIENNQIKSHLTDIIQLMEPNFITQIPNIKQFNSNPTNREKTYFNKLQLILQNKMFHKDQYTLQELQLIQKATGQTEIVFENDFQEKNTREIQLLTKKQFKKYIKKMASAGKLIVGGQIIKKPTEVQILQQWNIYNTQQQPLQKPWYISHNGDIFLAIKDPSNRYPVPLGFQNGLPIYSQKQIYDLPDISWLDSPVEPWIIDKKSDRPGILSYWYIDIPYTDKFGKKIFFKTGIPKSKIIWSTDHCNLKNINGIIDSAIAYTNNGGDLDSVIRDWGLKNGMSRENVVGALEKMKKETPVTSVCAGECVWDQSRLSCISRNNSKTTPQEIIQKYGSMENVPNINPTVLEKTPKESVWDWTPPKPLKDRWVQEKKNILKFLENFLASIPRSSHLSFNFQVNRSTNYLEGIRTKLLGGYQLPPKRKKIQEKIEEPSEQSLLQLKMEDELSRLIKKGIIVVDKKASKLIQDINNGDGFFSDWKKNSKFISENDAKYILDNKIKLLDIVKFLNYNFDDGNDIIEYLVKNTNIYSKNILYPQNILIITQTDIIRYLGNSYQLYFPYKYGILNKDTNIKNTYVYLNPNCEYKEYNQDNPFIHDNSIFVNYSLYENDVSSISARRFAMLLGIDMANIPPCFSDKNKKSPKHKYPISLQSVKEYYRRSGETWHINEMLEDIKETPFTKKLKQKMKHENDKYKKVLYEIAKETTNQEIDKKIKTLSQLYKLNRLPLKDFMKDKTLKTLNFKEKKKYIDKEFTIGKYSYSEYYLIKYNFVKETFEKLYGLSFKDYVNKNIDDYSIDFGSFTPNT